MEMHAADTKHTEGSTSWPLLQLSKLQVPACMSPVCSTSIFVKLNHLGKASGFGSIAGRWVGGWVGFTLFYVVP